LSGRDGWLLKLDASRFQVPIEAMMMAAGLSMLWGAVGR
jgi:hypothetical protein